VVLQLHLIIYVCRCRPTFVQSFVVEIELSTGILPLDVVLLTDIDLSLSQLLFYNAQCSIAVVSLSLSLAFTILPFYQFYHVSTTCNYLFSGLCRRVVDNGGSGKSDIYHCFSLVPAPTVSQFDRDLDQIRAAEVLLTFGDRPTTYQSSSPVDTVPEKPDDEVVFTSVASQDGPRPFVTCDPHSVTLPLHSTPLENEPGTQGANTSVCAHYMRPRYLA